MNWEQNSMGEDETLKQALAHLKTSVDAWSDAVLSRPRTATAAAARPAAVDWRTAAGWALGCLLVSGSLAGAAHGIMHRQEMAKLAAQKASQTAAEKRAEANREAALEAGARTEQPEKNAPAATAKEEENSQDAALLASVSKDVSREVPTALEPLAQLMDDSGTQ